MSSKADQLIQVFKEQGQYIDDAYERLFEFTSNSEEVFKFSSYFLSAFDQNDTIFNDSLSYIDKEHFEQLIISSLEILKRNKNENAESVIAHASFQFPELLHNHLELIFEIKPNEGAYYSEHPWRNLAPEKIEIFKSKFQSEDTPLSDKQRLFNCLLQTRDIKTIEFAFQFALNTKLFDEENLEDYLLGCEKLEDYLIHCIESVGFTIRKGQVMSYCPGKTKHFSFPKKYFIDEGPIYHGKEQHPTWILNPTEYKYKFGGLIQDDQNNPFVHLITFDKIPHGLSISGLERVKLGMHLRELNEHGVIFYQHDKMGDPMKIGGPQKIETGVDAPIKETEIALADTPERWQFQDFGLSNDRENLFRLGGEPTWLERPVILTCPICNEKMDFLMQLDTGLPDIEDSEVYFGNGGMCYVFWCDKSKVSGYTFQCT